MNTPPPLRGTEANNVVLDQDTELFWSTHRQTTGCQRPRTLAFVCLQLHLNEPRITRLEENHLTQSMPQLFAKAWEDCQDAKHLHAFGATRDCITRRWRRHLRVTAPRLDALLGIHGCMPPDVPYAPWEATA